MDKKPLSTKIELELQKEIKKHAIDIEHEGGKTREEIEFQFKWENQQF